ncbi:MAG: hypothetical protein LBL82_06935 [Oscillospiraceae bacterium]|jgi:hypothetical protein|nr:hypothetical protein [Oscillospiraceae bacterium]
MDEQRQRKLERAKTYIDKLADGCDPFTDAPLEDDSVLNNVRLSRCFFFVSEVLREVIDNGGVAVRGGSGSSKKLPRFELTAEQYSRIELSEDAIQITDLCQRINAVADLDTMRKLKVTAFGAWMLEKGFLTTVTVNDKKHKEPTPEGKNIGITSEWVDYQTGGYYRLKYSKNAQQFLVDNLEGIMRISNGE